MHLSRERESTRAPRPASTSHQALPRRARSKAQSDNRQEDRDRPEQMADALLDPVRRDRKREPTCQRRSAWQLELPQPCARREACEHVEEDLQDVPAARRGRTLRRAARRGSRMASRRSSAAASPPGGRCTGPARARVRARAGGRRASSGTATADGRRETLRRGRALRRRGSATGRGGRRPRRDCPGREVERSGERYKACAARSSSSKSGTSAVS